MVEIGNSWQPLGTVWSLCGHKDFLGFWAEPPQIIQNNKNCRIHYAKEAKSFKSLTSKPQNLTFDAEIVLPACRSLFYIFSMEYTSKG